MRKVAHKVYLSPGQALDAVTRARIWHLQFPRCVIGGWAALAYYGLAFDRLEAPQTLYCTRFQRRIAGAHFRKVSAPVPSTTPDPAFPGLRVATIPHATVDCLLQLRAGDCSWWVTRIEGLTFAEIRQVQLIDALRWAKLLTCEDLVTAARHRMNKGEVKRLIELSDDGAASPKETALRLILRDVSDWKSQVRIESPHGELLTVADLADEELKVAVFYDGEHHLKRSQRDYDSKVWAVLTQLGWRTFRVTNGMLEDPNWIVAHTKNLLAEAAAIRATRQSRMMLRRSYEM